MQKTTKIFFFAYFQILLKILAERGLGLLRFLWKSGTKIENRF